MSGGVCRPSAARPLLTPALYISGTRQLTQQHWDRKTLTPWPTWRFLRLPLASQLALAPLPFTGSASSSSVSSSDGSSDPVTSPSSDSASAASHSLSLPVSAASAACKPGQLGSLRHSCSSSCICYGRSAVSLDGTCTATLDERHSAAQHAAKPLCMTSYPMRICSVHLPSPVTGRGAQYLSPKKSLHTAQLQAHQSCQPLALQHSCCLSPFYKLP